MVCISSAYDRIVTGQSKEQFNLLLIDENIEARERIEGKMQDHGRRILIHAPITKGNAYHPGSEMFGPKSNSLDFTVPTIPVVKRITE